MYTDQAILGTFQAKKFLSLKTQMDQSNSTMMALDSSLLVVMEHVFNQLICPLSKEASLTSVKTSELNAP
jgi:hypothetical protein